MKQNDYKEQLHGQYRSVYERVEHLLFVELRDEEEQADRMSYLLDIFLSAQADGLPVEKVVGNDLRAFCRDFLDASSAKLTWRYILRSIKTIAFCYLWLLGAFDVTAFFGKLLEDGSWSRAALTPTSTVPLLLMGFALGMVYQLAARVVIHRIILRTRKYRASYGYTITGISILLHYALLRAVDTFWDGVILWPCWIGVALFGCLGIWKLIPWISKKIRLRRSAGGAMILRCSGDALCNCVVGCRIRFHRINKKRAKRNRPLQTEAEFSETFFRTSKKALRKNMIVFLIADLLLFVLQIPPTPDGKAFLDLIALAVWMLFAEYWIVRWTTLPQAEVAYLLKAHDRTLFDEDIGDFLMLYAKS